MNNIIFLNHDAAGDEESRRQIRARAAQHSHRIGPRKPKAKKKAGKSRSQKGQAEDEDPIRQDLARGVSSLSVASSATSVISRRTSVDESLISPATIDPAPRLGSYVHIPVDSYPAPYQPWFPEVVEYTWHFMLRGWKVLQTTPREREEAMLWVQRLTMQEPAYFYMNMLSATGDLVSQGRKDPRYVVWLTGEVVSAINKALDDPERALSVGTILAVGRLALREIIVGDMSAGMTYHRPAFARMIVMAGGVKALDIPELVRKHLAWADRLMTRKTGVRTSDLEPTLAHEETFGGKGGSVKDDMRVLDEYLPFRSKMLGHGDCAKSGAGVAAAGGSSHEGND